MCSTGAAIAAIEEKHKPKSAVAALLTEGYLTTPAWLLTYCFEPCYIAAVRAEA